jgi:hypothetical protein
MQEVWKQYATTNYSVSNTGYIRNDASGKTLSPARSRQGYVRLNIWDKGKTRSVAVHRLIAETFLPNPEGKAIVNHIDGNPSNNRLENLEWATISENVTHAYATGLAKRGEDATVAKLTEKQVVSIKELLKTNSIRSVATLFGMSDAAISHIRNGDTWSHVSPESSLALADKEKYHKYKLNANDIPIIRSLFASGLTDNQVATQYGVHRASIRNIRIGKNWANY